jgi:hypothetical protein
MYDPLSEPSENKKTLKMTVKPPVVSLSVKMTLPSVPMVPVNEPLPMSPEPIITLPLIFCWFCTTEVSASVAARQTVPSTLSYPGPAGLVPEQPIPSAVRTSHYYSSNRPFLFLLLFIKNEER